METPAQEPNEPTTTEETAEPAAVEEVEVMAPPVAPKPESPIKLVSTESDSPKTEPAETGNQPEHAALFETTAGDPKESKDSKLLTAFLKASLKLAENISSLRKEKKDLAHNAARMISHAFNEWAVVFEGLQKKPKPKIVEKSEEQLALYLKAAALSIAQFDEEHAKLCESAGETLLRASELSKVDLKKLSARLEEVCKRYETLLSPRLWITGQTGRPTPPPQA
jgi:hypothetical protein